MALIKEYLDITKKYSEEFGEKTILLMQNGAFFEVYSLRDEFGRFFGSKIQDFSSICDLNIVDKKAAGDKHVLIDDYKAVNAGFKTHLIEKYIKKLQNAGYTIVVYEEDDEQDSSVLSKKKNRSLTGVYSPGTYFSSESDIITNNTCCIWMEVKNRSLKQLTKQIYVGASQIDIYTGKSSIMEYNETYMKNPTTFDDLERFISIYKPSEAIIISNLSGKDLTDMISYINLQSKSIHYVSLGEDNYLESQCGTNSQRVINCEKQVYQLQLLNKFYKIGDAGTFMEIFNDNVYATQSFCYLLDFIYQHNPNLVNKIAEPVFENSSKRLVLANHSLKQLNIIDDDNYKGKYSSVLRMLNDCVTSMGKRKFADLFLNPITDEDELRMEYAMTEYIIQSSSETDIKMLKPILLNMKDISKINRQIMVGRVPPKMLHQLYSGISLSKRLYDLVIQDSSFSVYLNKRVKGFDKVLEDTNDLLNFIDSVVFIDKCSEVESFQKIETSFIKGGVDSSLDEKIETLFESKDRLECCRIYFDNIIGDYENKGKGKAKAKSNVSKKQLKEEFNDLDKQLKEIDEIDVDSKSYVRINNTEGNQFTLLATDRRCKILEEVLMKRVNKKIVLKYASSYYDSAEQEFVLDLEQYPLQISKQTASNNSIYNDQIKQLCKNVGTIKTTFVELISKVYYGKIVKKMEDYNEAIERICEFITYVDVILTKAHIAEKHNYCKPEIDGTVEKSFIRATNLRHCLIEKIQQQELYVANDLVLGTGCQDGILLYGTNLVGKTSLIRSIGIAQVMAQAGLFVPASKYIYKPYKYIFTRILGNDNLFKGLSTFAVEMSELRTILRLANQNSLVLGDELCSGTENISASSIFAAGIVSLTKVNCSFIFATHFHEILRFDEIQTLFNSKLKAKHMEVIYDKQKDCLVYNRKLKDGAGSFLYGLEVCKSLSLPEEFLSIAHNIRVKYFSTDTSSSVLDLNTSHYNSSHISGGICDHCKTGEAEEAHHLIYQQNANEKGIIEKEGEGLVFHKHNAANLVNLCRKCHDLIHKTKKQYKKTKTTNGFILEEV